MNRGNQISSCMGMLSAVLLLTAAATACLAQETPPAPPVAQRAVTTQPGVAGGVEEEVFTVQTVVSNVDQATRRVTLQGPAGREYAFTATEAVKNLPQLKKGDKVTATFARRLVITVRREGAAPSTSVAATQATALPGDKPGMLIAEETEAVGVVRSIDAANRTASIEFPNHVLRSVPVRSDVDLTKYKVGDNVTIRVTTALTLLVTAP